MASRTRGQWHTRLLVATALVATTGALTLSQGALATTTPPTPMNVTTYHYDNMRTGDDTTTPAITALSTSPKWDATLYGAVYGEPLMYNGRVIVGTENNTIFSLNPDNGRVAWKLHLGTAVRTSVIDQATGLSSGCGDIDPLGITGTPVIDATTNTIYVADETYVGASIWQNIRHELVAVSLSTHRIEWTRIIDPPGGNAAPGTPGGYTIAALQQRPALTLANGRVYVNFGGLAGDCGLYHGYVVALPTSGRGQLLDYAVPTQTEGAIWATSGALVDPKGNLYVTTGNGTVGAGAFDESDAILKLSPTLKLLSSWAPTNWLDLSNSDWDLGSAGPIFIPGTWLLFAAGKPANGSFGYIVWAKGLGSGPSPAITTGSVCSDPTAGVFGADASAVLSVAGQPTPFIFAACSNGTEALKVTTSPSPSFTQAWGPSTTSTGGSPIVSGGLVWALDFHHSQLVAYTPTTGAVVFQRSTDNLVHFVTPTVGNGLVLVPTHIGVEAFATTP